MADFRAQALISTADLARRTGDPGLVVLDATWHLPTAKRDARAEYAERHIPGARFFDIDAIADRQTDLPHMLPAAEDFADAVGALGIGNDSEVVAYDVYGLSSAPRAWWMFRVFAHDRVRVLDGGLPKWQHEGRPLEGGSVRALRRPFRAQWRPELVRGKADIEANVSRRAAQLVDARSSGRFNGIEPEPRAGLRGGHIPGSCNLPYPQLIDPETRTLLGDEALRARFAASGVDLSRPIITSCGSGITACVLALGLYVVGRDDAAVYDGSWAEWGRPGGPPVESG